ncbi:MAG: hypothetical protein ACFE9I_11435 [Candidatus Hermodarchaeota archaeon]
MKDDDSNLNRLKIQRDKFDLELDKKDQEIILYLDKINDLEEELMKLHELISKTPSNESIVKMIESKFIFELKEKEREIRDLKNRMGFLRQEKVILQRELEEFKKISIPSAKSIEEVRQRQDSVDYILNLESEINELRKELYTHEIIMGNLKKELEKKEDRIKSLNLNIVELNQELKTGNLIIEGKINKKIRKDLNSRVQKELEKNKKQIEDLKGELNKYKVSQRDKIRYDIEMSEFQNKINFLEDLLKKKDKIIDELKSNK